MKFFTILIAFASAGLVAGKKRGCAKAKEGCENDCKPFKGVKIFNCQGDDDVFSRECICVDNGVGL
ncbi:hypothetical protein ACKVWM_000329 [Pyricularia oryzae]|nr:hypothetical protein MCOR20_002718 [Pyricularia oryzae]